MVQEQIAKETASPATADPANPAAKPSCPEALETTPASAATPSTPAAPAATPSTPEERVTTTATAVQTPEAPAASDANAAAVPAASDANSATVPKAPAASDANSAAVPKAPAASDANSAAVPEASDANAAVAELGEITVEIGAILSNRPFDTSAEEKRDLGVYFSSYVEVHQEVADNIMELKKGIVNLHAGTHPIETWKKTGSVSLVIYHDTLENEPTPNSRVHLRMAVQRLLPTLEGVIHPILLSPRGKDEVTEKELGGVTEKMDRMNIAPSP